VSAAPTIGAGAPASASVVTRAAVRRHPSARLPVCPGSAKGPQTRGVSRQRPTSLWLRVAGFGDAYAEAHLFDESVGPQSENGFDVLAVGLHYGFSFKGFHRR
jgi:hypothetical protein